MLRFLNNKAVLFFLLGLMLTCLHVPTRAPAQGAAARVLVEVLEHGDDVARAARMARVAEGAQVAKYAKFVEDLRLPVAAGRRLANGISLAEVAGDVLAVFPRRPNHVPVYLGSENSGTRFIRDAGFEAAHKTKFTGSTLNDYSGYLRQHNPNAEIDYIVESDLLSSSDLEHLVKQNEGRVFLSNYAGKPLKIVCVDGVPGPLVELNPGLLAPIDDRLLAETYSLFHLSFSSDDIRVISVFQQKANGKTLDALSEATESILRYDNVVSREELYRLVGKRKGEVIVVVGHVENGSLVIREGNTVLLEQNIEELQQLAEANQSVLVFLGCETARIPNVSGFAEVVNSLEVAEQLRNALKANNYEDFFCAFGSPASPFVIGGNEAGKFAGIGLERLRKDAVAGQRAFKTMRVSSRLAKSQNELYDQMIRGIPSWLDNIIAFAVGLLALGILFSVLAAIYRHWQPILIFLLGLIIAPFYGLHKLFVLVTRPKKNPDLADRNDA